MRTAVAHPASMTRQKRWGTLATVLIGSLVGTLGNSMMNVALPSIMKDYHIGNDVGVWIITIYILLFSTLMPVCGRLGDMFGYKRIYLLGMSGLVLWFPLSALAPSPGWLIVFRVLSGIFNAPTLPAVMGIIAEVFPPNERGGAMGFWATVNGAAHGLGPALSGILVQNFGWPAVFWFNGAIALIGVVMIAVFVPADGKRANASFDPVGAASLTAMTILFMFNLTQGLKQNYEPGVTVALWGTCLGLLAVFIIWERRVAEPFVDLKLLGQRAYGMVTFVSSAQLFCLFGMQLLLPQFLIGVQGRAYDNAGWLILPLASTLALASPVAGRLSDIVGSRLTCAIGMGLVALMGIGLTFWKPDTPAWVIAVTLIFVGFGMGLTQSPTANAVTLVVGQEKLGVALGIFNMMRFVSGSLGTTFFGVILDQGARLGGGMSAFQLNFYLFTAVAAVAAVLSMGLPTAPARQTVPAES